MMSSHSLNAISPVDGRYAAATLPLSPYFSESALMRHRLEVEVEYFIELRTIPLPELADFPEKAVATLRRLYRLWDEKDALRIKRIEGDTNHDVKAVEYYLKEKFDDLNLSRYKEFIHFGLTSQDVNNTAMPLSISRFLARVYKPRIAALLERLTQGATAWKDTPMLARTHGQPASPTRLGKEINVFIARIKDQLATLEQAPQRAKLGGAVGNFNAHHIAYPNIDWAGVADRFISRLGLIRSHPTTQIDHYDHLAALFDNLRRINTILIDYSRDMWQYIAMDYFVQRVSPQETGSSTMPHKVNPIDFENAEGNLGVANALLAYLAQKLPVSRLQRDLTDSTVMRNIGTPLAHTHIAMGALERGIGKLTLNAAALDSDLEKNWTVVAEAIQTVLRRENYPAPYETLKAFTRGRKKMVKEEVHAFIRALSVRQEVKDELLNITPFNYTGI